jgi:hypothetical protein
LVLVSIPIVVLQAVKGPVLANWAIRSLIPGSVLAELWLRRHPWLAGASISLGLARPDQRPLLARYLGLGEVADWAIATAKAAGTLVVEGRDIMADLSWFGADAGPVFRAGPPGGRPSHH